MVGCPMHGLHRLATKVEIFLRFTALPIFTQLVVFGRDHICTHHFDRLALFFFPL